jgi:hypothetical protein
MDFAWQTLLARSSFAALVPAEAGLSTQNSSIEAPRGYKADHARTITRYRASRVISHFIVLLMALLLISGGL